MLILPAIDLRGGACVRLAQGRFDAVTRYAEDPLAQAEAFAAAGAEGLHVVDLDGAETGAPQQHALIGRIARQSGLTVQAGGGVRSLDDVARLLDVGVERAVVGSAAVSRPGEVVEWLETFGPDRVVLAIDVRTAVGEEPEAAIHGWTKGSGVTLWDALQRLGRGRPRHLLVTDVARDGMLSGPNLPLTAEIVRRAPELRLQSSGGVRSLDDLEALKDGGAAAAIVGKALYEGLFTLNEAIRRAR